VFLGLISDLRSPTSKKRGRYRGFTLLELLVVIGIISLLLVAVIPAVTSLSKSSGGKAAVSNLMNVFEQAHSLALTSGAATYVVFADTTTPNAYRCKAYVIFQEDKTTFAPVAITKWYFLPNGISFQPGTGLLTPQSGVPRITFSCPGTMGSAPRELPFIKFDSNGMVATPTDSATLFVKVFSGSVDAGGQASFTDQQQRTTGKLDQVAIAKFTGRVHYVDPYSG
jgi:prepilin-type N-terminal cleavage/methylation domain-containing protein